MSALNPVSEMNRFNLRLLAENYFFGVDHRDVDAVVSCFSSSCQFTINAKTPVTLRCHDEIKGLFDREPLFRASHHTVSHQTVRSDGTTLAGTVYATAHLVVGAAGRDRILVRGLRYDDQYVFEEGLWRMSVRVHNPLWQFEADAAALDLHDHRDGDAGRDPAGGRL